MGLNILPTVDVAIFSKQDSSFKVQKVFPRNQTYAFGRWIGSLRTFIFILSLFFRGLIQRPQLIFVAHAHFAPVAMLLKKITGQKYVVVVHGVEVWNMSKLWIKKSLEEANMVLSVSEYTKQKIMDQGYRNPANIMVFYNTFDQDKFKISKRDKSFLLKHGLQEKDKAILSVCRLVNSAIRKGYDLVLDAMVLFQKELPDFKYIIVGDGDDKFRLKSRISELGLADRVILVGEVSDEDLPFYYQNADVFVLPSEREGFGIVFLEAMACGLPVIAARCAGASEALLNGELGDLITPGDAKELAEKIHNRLSADFLTRNHREEVRRKVIAVFGFKIFCDRLNNAVDRVLSDE